MQCIVTVLPIFGAEHERREIEVDRHHHRRLHDRFSRADWSTFGCVSEIAQRKLSFFSCVGVAQTFGEEGQD
uniref:Uncharacterized protein n=1 Tax=Candidatus Kentrum sp. LFY TaxID=2126342 RepID=A0A450UU47_9GAMM|nr:MAG: hypothetical protein BECKLFY1418A_GA0070994_105525 [Candidatus Kentron sp. LFY]